MSDITANQIEAISEAPESEETEVTVESVIEELGNLISEEGLTAYRATVFVNQVFKALGVEKEIPTQMGYNYTKNGMIAKRTKGMSGKDVRYTRDEIMAWATKYVNKFV